jgi:CRP/FNR family transcriptional regulator
MYKERSDSNISCTNCTFSYLCIAKQFNQDEKQRLDKFIKKARIISKGEHLYRNNDKMDYIYAVYSGSLKDYYLDEDGKEYINNFYFPGDILALEAIPLRKYPYSVVALSDATLCMIPVNALFTELQTFPALLKRFLHINSYRMLNDKQIRPSTNAKQRVADFLVNMLHRVEERNGSNKAMQLPMSQLDMSNMIGVAYETVSRVLHYFESQKIIQIKNRQIAIVDVNRLKMLGNDTNHAQQH